AKASHFVPGMLYEAVNTVLALLWLPVSWLIRKSSLTESVYRRASRLKEDSGWRGVLERSVISPVLHPWRFVILTGLGIGTAYFFAHILLEGYSPDMYAMLTLLLIDLVVEAAALLTGFTLFGAFLGLRPPLIQGLKENQGRPLSTPRL